MELNLNEITLLLDIMASHWNAIYNQGSAYHAGPTLSDIASDSTMHEMVDLYCRLKAAFDQAEQRPL